MPKNMHKCGIFGQSEGGTNVLGYVVSNKYDNPTSIDGKMFIELKKKINTMTV